MDVEYRGIPGYPGYDAGDDGSIWSYWIQLPGFRVGGGWIIGTERRQLAQGKNKRGYKLVGIRRGSWIGIGVHRLVLLAFRGAPPPGMECRHLDGDPGNNQLSNLVWGTRKQNAADTIRHGRNPFAHQKKLRDALSCSDLPTSNPEKQRISESLNRRKPFWENGLRFFAVLIIQGPNLLRLDLGT